MNAFGFASKSARDIFSRVARSVEPVIWEAISLSDCPGFTLYCVIAAAADAAAGAEASETADALLAWALASEETNVPSSTLATLAAISAARRERLGKRSCESSGRLGRTIIDTPGEWTLNKKSTKQGDIQNWPRTDCAISATHPQTSRTTKKRRASATLC